mgnify:FL=1|tara:strand:+ start:205 stop:708 length:504 start_codon:yes stop_codon:yes gene_type:complete
MRVIDNVLSDSLISRCRGEVDIKISQNEMCWASSTLLWSQKIQEGITGSCLASLTSEEINESIIEEILPHVPNDVKQISTRYYMWQPNSGISIHNDGDYRFGATIYLNPEWHPNCGGWFIWRDKNINEWKVILPTENTMVINIDKEEHLVTPVAPDKFRITVQIWGS